MEDKEAGPSIMNGDDRMINRTVPWEELDKPKFYALSVTCFLGMRLVVHPMHLLKTKLQVNREQGATTTVQLGKKIVRTEGVRGLYKFYFTTYEIIRKRLGPGSIMYERLGEQRGEVARNMAAGGGSSSVMQLLSVPSDVIAQRMMVYVVPEAKAGSSGNMKAAGMATAGERSTPKTRQVIRQIYAESGFLGFYRGLGVSMLQFAPSNALWWTSYGLYAPVLTKAVERAPFTSSLSEQKKQAVAQSLAGLLTGATTIVVTNPLDVLRTRLQVDGRRGDDRTFRSEFRLLIKESGPKGLMRGVNARLVAYAPMSSIIITLYETIKRVSRQSPVESSEWSEEVQYARIR